MFVTEYSPWVTFRFTDIRVGESISRANSICSKSILSVCSCTCTIRTRRRCHFHVPLVMVRTQVLQIQSMHSHKRVRQITPLLRQTPSAATIPPLQLQAVSQLVVIITVRYVILSRLCCLWSCVHTLTLTALHMNDRFVTKQEVAAMLHVAMLMRISDP